MFLFIKKSDCGFPTVSLTDILKQLCRLKKLLKNIYYMLITREYFTIFFSGDVGIRQWAIPPTAELKTIKFWYDIASIYPHLFYLQSLQGLIYVREWQG